MTTKRQLIVGIISLAILVGFIAVGFHTSSPAVVPTVEELAQTSWPSQELEKINVNEKTDHYEITVSYPKTVSDSITLQFRSYIDDQIAQFKDDTSWVDEVGSASDGVLTLDISYKSSGSKAVQTYIFLITSYTGGAHGMQVHKMFSYNKKTGQILGISDVFSNGIDGLKTLSVLVQKELMKREGADAKWVAEGAAPTEENYGSFVITDEGVTIIFDQYQVAPYSDGAIDIAIPVSAFAKIANKELFNLAQ